MSVYRTFVTRPGRTATPQTEPIPGTNQVPNMAGGYSFSVDDWARLRRFLILGTEGGTYYVDGPSLVAGNAEAVLRCVGVDGGRVLDEIVAISTEGRAPSNDPALFTLALLSAHAERSVRVKIASTLRDVARTGTHLFHFAQYVSQMRGWGRGLRRAVADWYIVRTPRDLAFQLTKYQARDGWSHRDLLRLAHPKAVRDSDALLRWAVGKNAELSGFDDPVVASYMRAVTSLADSPVEIATALIRELRLPREVVPTEMLTRREVWEALLADMPITALIRNLATLTRVGVLGPMAEQNALVAETIRDGNRLRVGRVHPIQILAALVTYEQGRGMRSDATWTPVPIVVDALNDAFYLAFGNVEPTGKRVFFGLDVSGSMAGTKVNGIPGMDCRRAVAAMALVVAHVEPQHVFVAFDEDPYPLSISATQRLDDVLHSLETCGGGGTDCAIPMVYAKEHRIPVDCFVILTDSETWAGKSHPAEALAAYRRTMGIHATLVNVAMTATESSIGDQSDPAVFECVGFDTHTPQLISALASGQLLDGGIGAYKNLD